MNPTVMADYLYNVAGIKTIRHPDEDSSAASPSWIL